jgi:hypothetical protein
MRAHFKVFLIAAVFGLGAYAAIHALLFLSREFGLLGWLR